MPGPINSNVPSSQLPQTSGTGETPDAAKTTTTEATGGGPGGPPAPADTAEQVKGAKDHATAKKADQNIQAQARGLAPAPTKEQQIRAIASQAKKSGLEDAQITKLTDRLKGLDQASFKSEVKFLNTHVMNNWNTDRALRTYNDLKDMQAKHADRLSEDTVQTLTRAVAERRTDWTKGREGVMGQDGALNAAKALVGMSAVDFKWMNKSLNWAGHVGPVGATPKGGSAFMEKALILKAAGARVQDFTKPYSGDDWLWNVHGMYSHAMNDVFFFANDIRGSQRDKMARESTAIDPYAGNAALQQRWNDSCGPTSAQAMKAELDPIYARKLHQEIIHGTGNAASSIADEQKKVLTAHGGVAVNRGAAGGVGTKLTGVLNDTCKAYTGVTYAFHTAGSTNATRLAALSAVEAKLKAGVDVPIRAGWPPPGGGGHFMILTDVRGEGKKQQFLLTDPWQGKTVWISRDDLANGATKFPAGTGALTDTYY